MAAIDRIGNIFGDLTVREYVSKDRVRCSCKCGNESYEVLTSSLTRKRRPTVNCGASLHKTDNHRYITGQKFGRLLAFQFYKKENNKFYYKCICDCGNETIVSSDCLKKIKGTKSCGCLAKERASESSKKRITHGKSSTTTYRIWFDMKRRCTDVGNKNYSIYGGKGVSVCTRWHKFENFLADMGERPSKDYTLDRINSNGNYELSNCRWADVFTQANNRSNNRILIFNGESMTMTQLSKKTGIEYRKLQHALKKGLTVEETVQCLIHS